ncbi:MAG: hypothetical protein LBR15_11100 [Methanobrevibacter sp.]|jgi:hypothetical protein|nr:hypothetical protein [Candidatus Methanovirga australis]
MNYSKILLAIGLIAILAISSMSYANAATGNLHVIARNQDNDGDGYIVFDEHDNQGGFHPNSKSIFINKNSDCIIPLYNNISKIRFISKKVQDGKNHGEGAHIWHVNKFMDASVNHDITVHVNFYDKDYYDNTMWIEGGWYEGSKNIYHPTWGTGSSIHALEWNVAMSHWNKFR